MFFDILLNDATSDIPMSYNQMAIEAKSKFGMEISKQAIADRFNEGALRYTQNLLGEYLSEQVYSTINTAWFDLFGRVIIKDSTKFDLPEELQKDFPGFGGSASKAGCCIQYEFDIKSGQGNDLTITPANRPDSRDAAGTTYLVKEGDLTIRDLGYFSLKYFKAAQKNRAYFLSRLNTNVIVYQKKEDKYIELDFGKLYQTMKEGRLLRLDIQAYIGRDDKFPVRLIIEPCPDEVFNTRMKKINKENKKRGNKTSDGYKDRARFSLYMTNVPSDKIEGGAISKIYKIRWQIELVFKTWKSIFNLDKVKKMKYGRLMCLLNIRLLLIMINWEVFSVQRAMLFKKTGKLLSQAKSLRTLKDNIEKIRKVLTTNCKGIKKWMKWVITILQSKHWLESKKNKIGLEELLQLNVL
jgi:hypothetical protein